MMYLWLDVSVLSVLVIGCVRCELSVLKQCVARSPTPALMHCVGEQAIQTLQTYDEASNFTLVEGLTLSRDERAAGRSLPDMTDLDPSDFRSILENSGVVFGERSMNFELTRVYPGLHLQIRPESGGSIMEFVLDSSREVNERWQSEERVSTAHVLTKKFILPFLLGLKFNLVTIIPIIFAVIIFLCKKAAFLAKIALFLSGIFGFGGLFGLGALADSGGHYGGHNQHHSYSGHNSYGSFSPGLGAFADSHGYLGRFRNEKSLLFDNTKEVKADPTQASDGFYNYERNYLLHDRQERTEIGRMAEEPEANTGEEIRHRDVRWKTL